MTNWSSGFSTTNYSGWFELFYSSHIPARSISRVLQAFALLAIFLVAVPFSANAKPQFSAITVDARTGSILFSKDPDGIRHPASLTKVMTLYILFQELKAGRLKLSTPLLVSARASRMPPSKMGLRSGSTITVEQAIKSLVIKSANDVAAVVAENLGGSESNFALRMTKTARSLGMSRTNYANASGLPNSQQVSTARDQATLALRMMRDFPQYYPYFRMQNFSFNGRIVKTHNRLVGRYRGTDGIKTGYVAASGYNLTTSTLRGQKRLVGVVFGSRSAAQRNAYMMQMLERNFANAKSGTTIAALAGSSKGAINPLANGPVSVAAAAPVPPAPEVGEKDKLALASETAAAEEDDSSPSLDQLSEDAAEEVDPDALPTDGKPKVIEAHMDANAMPAMPKKLPFEVKAKTASAGGVIVSAAADEDDWNIQIGAFDTQKLAQARLKWIRGKGFKQLQGKTSVTTAVQQGQKTYYRARFSGFTESAAREACTRLVRAGQACKAVSPSS